MSKTYTSEFNLEAPKRVLDQYYTYFRNFPASLLFILHIQLIITKVMVIFLIAFYFYKN